MFENYAVTAFRNLVKYPTQSLINIVGMAVGLAASILIFLYVQDEMSWDAWIENSDEIYRFEIKFNVPGRDPFDTAGAPGPLQEVFADQIPEVATSVRIIQDYPTLRRSDGEAFYADSIYVDDTFLDIFNLVTVSGNLFTALMNPNSAVISESLAEQFFGDEDPIGQFLTYTGQEELQIVGVFADMPHNTHMEMDMIRLFVREDFVDRPWYAEQWTSINTFFYFKLEPNAAIETLDAKMPDFLSRNIPPMPFGGQMVDISGFAEVSLVPVPDIHLYNAGKFGYWTAPGDIQTVYAFSAVAFAVLLIAAINFMNLATARSTLRAREVAMRKVMGANRRELILQFLGESVFMTALSMVAAIALVELALPAYNGILDRELAFNYLQNSELVIALIGLVLFVGLVGGLYPAVFLSQFRPAQTLKANQSSQAGGSTGLRAALVVLQFGASIVLMIATGVIFAQTQYALNLDKGYNEENVLLIAGSGGEDVVAVRDVMVDRLEALPNVVEVSLSSDLPTSYSENNTIIHIPGRTNEVPEIMGTYAVDFDYLDGVGLDLVAGRWLSPDYGQDFAVQEIDGEVVLPEIANVVLNETATRSLGFSNPADAIGFVFQTALGPYAPDLEEVTMSDIVVVGVVRDFNESSLRETVRPIMLHYNEGNFRRIIVRYSGSAGAIMEDARLIWREMVPDRPFRSTFLDDRVANQYSSELAQAKILGAFSLLAVFVACLGLFGLAAFSAERRTKEIGIRKSLGASTQQIVKLLVWQFSTPVLIANLIAWPAAYLLMQRWLEGFVYRIDLNPLLFIGASLAALLIAWATVSLHAVRAAMTRPALAMRYE